jgi:hypothetical protein
MVLNENNRKSKDQGSDRTNRLNPTGKPRVVLNPQQKTFHSRPLFLILGGIQA